MSAADLPVGSVVTIGMTDWTKFRTAANTDQSAWETDMGDRRPDWFVDRLLAQGAQVTAKRKDGK